MNNQYNEDDILILKAIEISNLSHANKRKVGCVIANHKTGEIISIGYNKMFDSLGFVNCEDDSGETIPYVIHAEEMAIIEMLKHLKFIRNMSELTLYVTYAPCINCAKYIAHIGIRRVVYTDKHQTKFDGVKHSPNEFLELMNIDVIEYKFLRDIDESMKDYLKGIDVVDVMMKKANHEMVGLPNLPNLKKLGTDFLNETDLKKLDSDDFKNH